MKGRTRHDILHVAKKNLKGGHFMTYYTSGYCSEQHVFNTLLRSFATVNLRIHAEFLNDERRKEKDR